MQARIMKRPVSRCSSLSFGRSPVAAPGRGPRRRGHVDLQQLPQGQAEAEVRRLASTTSGSTRAAVLGAAGPGLLGQLRLGRGPGDDQPPLRRTAASSSSPPPRRTSSRTATTPRRASDELQLPRAGGQPAGARSPTSPSGCARPPPGLTDQKYNEAEKAELSRIEKECATSADVRCDVVTLYRGGVYNLYKYQRFQDVRLVFAPELAIAFFGGDPDNFNFPRYDLDVTLPARLPGRQAGARCEHYLTLVGRRRQGRRRHLRRPGTRAAPAGSSPWPSWSTSATWRCPNACCAWPSCAACSPSTSAAAPSRSAPPTTCCSRVENRFKALRGRHRRPAGQGVLRQAGGAASRSCARRSPANPEWQKSYGGAWDAIAKAQEQLRGFRKPYGLHRESGRASPATCSSTRARWCAPAEERPKPNEKRFREFRDSALPGRHPAAVQPRAHLRRAGDRHARPSR